MRMHAASYLYYMEFVFVNYDLAIYQDQKLEGNLAAPIAYSPVAMCLIIMRLIYLIAN